MTERGRPRLRASLICVLLKFALEPQAERSYHGGSN